MDDKQKLFEMMGKVNPDFNINELYDSMAQQPKVAAPQPATVSKPVQTAQPNQVNQPQQNIKQPKQTYDAQAVDKFTQKSSQLKNYSKKIDTPKEFQESFENWFKTTGFYTAGKKLSISQALTMVRRSLMSLGLK